MLPDLLLQRLGQGQHPAEDGKQVDHALTAPALGVEVIVVIAMWRVAGFDVSDGPLMCRQVLTPPVARSR
jgi:hypothetical protein